MTLLRVTRAKTGEPVWVNPKAVITVWASGQGINSFVDLVGYESAIEVTEPPDSIVDSLKGCPD